MKTILARRPAMRTLFEIVLVGEDEPRLRSLAEDAFDAIERVERLLSRFDPAAEVYRLNRSAGAWVLVDPELLEVLKLVTTLRTATDGWFEPFRMEAGRERFEAPLLFDASRRAVRFATDEVVLDLGAFGKGYALDVVEKMLDRADLERWLLSGGGSSVAARGLRDDGTPWCVRLEDPFDAATRRHVAEFPLENLSLSTSSSVRPGASAEEVSDLIDPLTGFPSEERASCCVLHASAAAAEAWSTALLAAGRARATALLDRACESADDTEYGEAPARVYWIDRPDGVTRLELLSGEGHALADRSA